MKTWTENLKYLADIGFWDMANTLIFLISFIYGISILVRRHKRFEDLNFYITWKRDATNKFPLVLHFEVRNLSHHVVVLSSPKFKFDKMKPGAYAHCDTLSGDYELKFRIHESDTQSEVATLLKHRDIATSYLPLDESQTDADLKKLSDEIQMGTFYCTATFIEKRPKVRFMKFKLTGLVLNQKKVYINNKPQI